MKNVARVLVSIVALAVYPVVAHAQLTLVTQSGSSTTTYVGFNSSYTFQAAPGTANGWTAEGPTAASALTYTSTAAEYWAAPIGTSTWVSFEPNTQPGGVNDGNTNTDIGAYEYMSNAFATTAGSTYQLQILADNTTAIYLQNSKGTYLIASYPAGYSSTDVDGATPDYSTVDYIIIPSSELALTGNVLYFDVSNTNNQGWPGSPTGLDYALYDPTPEPGSFILLATGMVGAVGAVRRRVRA